MRSLRVLWVATLLLLPTSVVFGQSLSSVRPRPAPSAPAKASGLPGRHRSGPAAGIPTPKHGAAPSARDRLRWPEVPERPERATRNPSSAGPAGPPPVNLVHLQKHTVKVTVVDGIATTQIDQTYRNGDTRVMEASWMCPLPPQTVLHGFSIWMGGREVHAAVMDRTTARRVYDRIVGRRKDPGLVELVAGNVIRTSIFPIPAKGEFRIRTRYSSVITGDSVTLPFPKTPAKSRAIDEVKADLVFRSAQPMSLSTSKDGAVRLTRQDKGRFWSGKLRASSARGRGPIQLRCRSGASQPSLLVNVHRSRTGDRTFAAIVTAGQRRLSKARLSFDGPKVVSMYPEKIPELRPGCSVVVFGRLKGAGKPISHLRARQGLRPVRISTEVAKSATTAAETRHIPCFWAWGEFHELKKDPKKRAQALDLAIRYGILTELTALLAK